jgi:hypothetical protein
MQRHGTDRRPEQVGALRECRPDQQTTVGAAPDGQPLRFRPPLVDEILGGGDEVVEGVLLAAEHPGPVPVLAVLPSPAEVGDGVAPAGLQPGIEVPGERREHVHGEAAVAVEEERCRPVSGGVTAMHQKHRDPGAVLRREEDLLHHVGRGIDRDFPARPPLGGAGGDLEPPHLRRGGERAEVEEHLVAVGRADEPARRPDPR